MPNTTEVLFSLAGRIHVLLRRETNRIIDVEWMCTDGVYAREIVGLVSKTDSDELHKLAERIKEVHPHFARQIQPEAAEPESKVTRYMNTLR